MRCLYTFPSPPVITGTEDSTSSRVSQNASSNWPGNGDPWDDRRRDTTSPEHHSWGLETILEIKRSHVHSHEISDPVASTSSPDSDFVECEVCGKWFWGKYRRRNLSRHNKEKHGISETRYQCEAPGCGKVFLYQGTRAIHHRRQHPEMAAIPVLPKQRADHTACTLGNYRDTVHNPLHIAQTRQVSRIAGRSSTQEHFVTMCLNATTVMAFPDTCSSVNIISEQFLHRRNIAFDSQLQHSFRLPDGKEVNSIGVVELEFRLEGDASLHQQAFSVLRNCVHDVILGHSFLERIQLFTKFIHRLEWIPRALLARVPRVCLVESPQQAVRGSINVNLISRALAESLGFLIDTDSHRVITLEFIDGSTASTYGVIPDAEWRFDEHEESTETSSPRQPSPTMLSTVVRDWNFGDDATSTDVYLCDFYVLDNLTTFVILSSDLLLGSNAFKACAPNFRATAHTTKRQREERETDVCYIRKQKKRRFTHSFQWMLKPALIEGKARLLGLLLHCK
jgi:hypothetical protein